MLRRGQEGNRPAAAAFGGGPPAGLRVVKELYRYIWKVSARDQVLLSLLAAALFLIELVPLELQRRIVNGAGMFSDIHDLGTTTETRIQYRY